MFQHHFAVRASVQASVVPRRTALRETEKAAVILGALASVLVDLSWADLERLQAASRLVAPAGLCRPPWARRAGSDGLRATSNYQAIC